jgi:curved DNA-binding protein CbpA
MSDHYELLGVEPDATKDEIRAAYRSEIETADSARRAELNRAWNVLSDPIQRQRYDASLEVDGDGDEVDLDDEDAAPVPARRVTGARRGAQVERGDDAAGRPGSNGRADDGGGNRRVPPPPTIEFPEGMVVADAKTRSLAMVFDVSVLLVIFLIVQFVGVQLIQDQYPKETDRVDTLTKQVDKADKAKTKADDAKSKADDHLSSVKKKNASSETVAEARADAEKADAKAKAAQKKVDNLNEQLTKAQNKLRPMYLLLTAAVIVLALLYTVPMSARTGQTFGKRLRKVRLVKVDGSDPGWGASLIHYGIPIVITLALSGFLGPLALVLGLGCVLWNIRDRNRQGVHDKLAKTLVVEA